MDPHPPLEVLLQGGTANVAILTEAHHVPFTSVDTLMCATFPDAGVLTPEFSVCRVGSPNKLACQAPPVQLPQDQPFSHLQNDNFISTNINLSTANVTPSDVYVRM